MSMNIQKMMKQVQDLQKKMTEQQEAMADRVYEASVGGGMVSIKVNGRNEVLSVVLDPEILKSGDKEMLQDLLVAGMNEALRRVQEAQQDGMSGLMGNLGVKIPGLF